MILTWNLDQYWNLTREIKQCQKNLAMTSCQQIVTSLVFFQFMANLEQSRGRIPDAQSVKFTFSLTAAFYLTKIENRTKKSLTQLSHYCFELWCHFCKKKMLIFCKKMLTSAKPRGSWYWKLYFLKLYMGVWTYVPNFKFLP